MSTPHEKVKESILGDTYTHPSYGTLLFSRTTASGSKTLFGSSIMHRDTIVMRLYHAEVTRGLNSDRYMGRRLIAEAEMSQAQFAEAITSMNIGDGVPVTLRFLEKDGHIEEADFINKRTQFQSEFSEKLEKTNQQAKDLLGEVRALFDSKASIGKADRAKILSMLEQVVSNMTGNQAFIYKQFTEQMDRTVTEAKAEIEAFAENKLRAIAAETIARQTGTLSLGAPANPVDTAFLGE